MGRAVQAEILESLGPQPGPQEALLALPDSIHEAVLGGARGGGKTFGMLLDWFEHASTHGEHAKGMFVRRTFKQLEKVIEESKGIFRGTGAGWRKGDATWVWVSGPARGATLTFRHLWDEDDAEDYQGHDYTWICFEEMTNWPTKAPIDRMRATLRSAHGVPVKFRGTCNPGGAGHGWVKDRYIKPARNGYVPIYDQIDDQWRVFIPARLEDNPKLVHADPAYERRLMQSGPEALVKAWRWGEWDIVAGGFFDDVFNAVRHVIKPIEIPAGWLKRRSFDWGSASPSSLGLWAESTGEPTRDGWVIPRGSLVRVGEWYAAAQDGAGETKPNEGMRLAKSELGKGIAQRANGDSYSISVADPSIFTEQGGPSIYDQMVGGARDANMSLHFDPADNERVAGWQLMREMLEESGKDHPEKPGLWIFETCTDWIRTVPILQQDERRPDDVDTDLEDHAADETRYCLMARRKEFKLRQITGI